MKGIILAGGTGSRLSPITKGISKQLLPIYDKPMIFYSLTTLMLGSIRDILLITTPQDIGLFKRLLGNGAQWGINIEYQVQPSPRGLCEAFILGEKFINNSPCALILGDNLFHGDSLSKKLQDLYSFNKGATIFTYQVNDPKRYGVVEFNSEGKALSIEEKPNKPKSSYAITGLYYYDSTVVERSKLIKPSSRGELEITDLNKMYLSDDLLFIKELGRGMAWLDTGTFESLHEASGYIKTIESRQGLKVGSPEEVSWRMGWISDNELEGLANQSLKSEYGKYLIKLLNS